MNSFNVVTLISTIASQIALDKSDAEINFLSTVFSQLGDTLATISAFNNRLENTEEGSGEDCPR